jgi:uncharacterized RDD family membrane protein YckC
VTRAEKPFVPLVPPVARPFQGAPAGIASRVAAGIIDMLLILIVLLIGYACVAAVMFLAHPRTFDVPVLPTGASGAIAAFGAMVYLSGSWATTGRTFGDRILGLRVVTRAGGPLGATRATLRAVAYVLVPVGLVWACVSRYNRSLQDIVLRTSVVYDWE